MLPNDATIMNTEVSSKRTMRKRFGERRGEDVAVKGG
jgi:hypothetical protein